MKIGLPRLLIGAVICLAIVVTLTMSLSFYLHGEFRWKALHWTWGMMGANAVGIVVGLHMGLGENNMRFLTWSFGSSVARTMGLLVAGAMVFETELPAYEHEPFMMYLMTGYVSCMCWEISSLMNVSRKERKQR